MFYNISCCYAYDFIQPNIVILLSNRYFKLIYINIFQTLKRNDFLLLDVTCAGDELSVSYYIIYNYQQTSAATVFSIIVPETASARCHGKL